MNTTRRNGLAISSGVAALMVTASAQFPGKQVLPDIYPSPSAAAKQIAAAISKASNSHRRVILDFGGNWCGDCRALDRYFHEEPNASLLKSNFVLVDVNIGRFDKNLDIAKKYGVPLNKGVPALAVLDEKGRPLFSQQKGEFESMRTMAPSSVTEFLNHWRR